MIEKELPVMEKMMINNCPLCGSTPLVECTLVFENQTEQNTKTIVRNDFNIYYNCKCLNCGFETDLGKWNRLRGM